MSAADVWCPWCMHNGVLNIVHCVLCLNRRKVPPALAVEWALVGGHDPQDLKDLRVRHGMKATGNYDYGDEDA